MGKNEVPLTNRPRDCHLVRLPEGGGAEVKLFSSIKQPQVVDVIPIDRREPEALPKASELTGIHTQLGSLRRGWASE